MWLGVTFSFPSGKGYNACMKVVTKSKEETKKLAEGFVSTLKPQKNCATVVCLIGDLGSGKTTFVQGLAFALDIKETIQSPTFVLMKRFAVFAPFKNMIHVDAYRIEDEKELEQLDFKAMLSDSGNLIIIEWPERIKNSIPENALNVSFSFIDDVTREITLTDYADKK